MRKEKRLYLSGSEAIFFYYGQNGKTCFGKPRRKYGIGFMIRGVEISLAVTITSFRK